VLGEFGEVYVLDWGIARVVGDAAARADLDEPGALDTLQTVAGSVLGTPGYMSPEQVRGADDLDGRADVYALGCILFELLALAPAHPPGLMGIHAALHGKSPAPSSLAPDRDIPPELDAICTVALDGDRDKRFTTARALAEAVQRFLDGDRDLALRRDLARGELEAARTALARGNSPADREAALRAAARAIALDPTQREPAELVGRLMLEPPAETPREVEDVLYELDLDAFEEARPVLAFSGLTFMAFLPMLWLTGFHAPWFFGVAAVFATTIAVLAKLSPRARGVGGGRVILLAWAGLVVLLAIMMTPILAAPGVAAVVAMGVAAHPRVLSRWLLMALMVGAVLVPWLLAVVGVLPDTVTVDGNTIVLHAYTDALAPTPALVGLALFVVQMIVLAVLLANRQAVSRRAAQHAVELQAWQLRQLVSTASAEAPR
jgi:serine/threonine-protein kinase